MTPRMFNAPNTDTPVWDTAPCQHAPAVLTFQIASESRNRSVRESAERYAIKVCRSCPLQNPCATSTRQMEAVGLTVYGVAGGLTEQARRRTA